MIISNEEKSRRSRTAAINERIGDGSQLTAADFPLLNYGELKRLAQVNPERYAALRDGLDPDTGPWRPSTEQGAGL